MSRFIPSWFRRNAYGVFTGRLLVAMASACVSLMLSTLPHDAILQAIWVVVSTMFMGWLVLRERLNEDDDARYRRLFQSRFDFLKKNDPEALTTVFAENLRPRVYEWFRTEYDVDLKQAHSIDALDSLARSGDLPGQLIFRTGVELGEWREKSRNESDKLVALEGRLQQFVKSKESLLGEAIADGVYIRHIRRGEQRPAGVHMFHPASRLLLTIEYYDQQQRHAIALSTRTWLFTDGEPQFETFKKEVFKVFPEFQPANGGSGPQRLNVPFFVSPVNDKPLAADDALAEKLRQLLPVLPEVPKPEPDNDTSDSQ